MEINEIEKGKTMGKVDEIKNWFFERINKIDEQPARQTTKEKTIWKRGNIIDPIKIKRLMRKCYIYKP